MKPSLAPPAPFLPQRLKLLFITGRERTGQWLAAALAGDSASEVHLEEATGVAAGLARLRDEVFDAVLLSHEPPELDALDFLEAVRTGSSDEQPSLVLGSPSEQELAALCYEVGADAYISVHTTTTRTLLWQLARAVERHTLLAENRRLAHAQQHQLQREQDEARKLLGEQRELVERGAPLAGDESPLPKRLVEHYRELLKAYIIMGSGHLHGEIAELADLLVAAGAPARDALRLHTAVLDEVIQGLGNRSARHVMNRADLLAIEVFLNVAERYRQRFIDQLHPPQQQTLPGFDRIAVA
jgi:DNA-binding response OmpR family regulator